MTSDDLLLPAWGLAATSVAMAAAWLRQRRTGNAGIVDVLWTAALGLLGLAYAALADGWLPRRVLVGSIIALWAARLGYHLAVRVLGEDEDGRYRALRAQQGANADRWFFWFFQAQAVLAVLLSLAVLVPATATDAGWRAWDVVAVAVFLVSQVGETVADRQLAAWRADPANRGRTCRRGLWAWSRHPNYFFEWLHWFVYPLVAVGLPGGAWLWVAPALMLFLILKVTGIPPTEARALASRGDDYRAYQRTTNAFFPAPPRTTAIEEIEASA